MQTDYFSQTDQAAAVQLATGKKIPAVRGLKPPKQGEKAKVKYRLVPDTFGYSCEACGMWFEDDWLDVKDYLGKSHSFACPNCSSHVAVNYPERSELRKDADLD